MTFLFVNQIYQEPLNGFMPNSKIHMEDMFWSLARMSLNVKVKLTRDKPRCALPSPLAATEWNALAANNVMQQQKGPFRHCGDVILWACMRFMFRKEGDVGLS